jgi:Holliday junction resolvase RusA-like endonuclease
MLEFKVEGIPIAQGSKNAYVRNGRAVLVESANKKTKTFKAGRLKKWRQQIVNAAIAANKDKLFFEKSVSLNCEFVFLRPVSHYNKSGVKSSAPRAPGKPDLSKLVRAVEDALTDAKIWRDDAQVTIISAVKRYCEDTDKEHAKIQIASF